MALFALQIYASLAVSTTFFHIITVFILFIYLRISTFTSTFAPLFRANTRVAKWGRL